MGGPTRVGQRMPQLDGLRALGVVAMVAHHWLPASNPVTVIFRWGGIGMQMFFVMSGFLVTGILLRMKRAVDAHASTRRHALRQFYVRRVIRIFPVYYLVIALMVMLNYPNVRHGVWWHVAFLTNFQVGFGYQPPGYHLTMPFWTLAVEEQFYLVWPCLMLAVPGRWVLATIVGSIVFSPVSVYVAGRLGVGPGFGLMMPACLQFLGVGALLGVADYPEYARGVTRTGVERLFLWGSVPGLLAFGVLEGVGYSSPWFAWGQAYVRGIMAAMFFGWVIAVVGRGVRGVAGRALEGPLGSVGRVSYGVYAYHTFTAYTIMWVMTRPAVLSALGLSDGTVRQVVRLFVVRLGAVLVVAAASWWLIEGPMGRLKERFPYPKAPPKGRERAVEATGALVGAVRE